MFRLRRRTDTLLADSLMDDETQETTDDDELSEETCPECGGRLTLTGACAGKRGRDTMTAGCGYQKPMTAALDDKVQKVMHEFKMGKLRLPPAVGKKRGAKVTSRKQALAIALSEADRATTAAVFTAEERRKMADAGEALPDGSYPIPDVEYLRKAIGALGRASQNDEYARVKRHIVKRARALDAIEELPEDWNVTAAMPVAGFVVKENSAGRFEVVDPDGKKVAETTTVEDAQIIADEKNGDVEPDEDEDDVMAAVLMDSVTDDANSIVAAIPVHPPAEWFANPELDGPTPITITSDGRIYGHAALWGTCHLGNPRGAGVCVQPPRSQTDYGLFHLGELETAEGARVPVGQITLDTGHAPLGASARSAAAHYDDTGSVVADVGAGEDEHGIYFAGALRPDATPEKVRKLLAAKISGDWRGGELVGMLAVNVPGFPVPRTKARLVADAGGTEEVMALVAAGIVGEHELDSREIEIRVQVLAARAEGGIAGLAELAER